MKSLTSELYCQVIHKAHEKPGHGSPIESVGGKLHGGHDGYNLWDVPDNVSMAAVAIAIGSGGALSKFETTRCDRTDQGTDRVGHDAFFVVLAAGWSEVG